MKRKILFTLAFLLVVSSIVFASAISALPANQKTVIAGKIYDSPNFETANGVVGANVNVTCNGKSLSDVSQSDGTYSISYIVIDGVGDVCLDGANVTVVAEKNGIYGYGNSTVHDYTAIVPDLYIGVVNIALVPEFSLIIGTLTILSAIGIFFVIRRK